MISETKQKLHPRERFSTVSFVAAADVLPSLN